MKPICLVTAPVGTQSGYGAHSRDIVHSLIELDRFDIKIWPVRWGTTSQNALNKQNSKDKLIIDRLLTEPSLPKQPDIHIHIVVPNEFNALGKYNIGITAGTETTICPADWVEGLNRMDLNIVPSTFSKNVLQNAEFTRINKQTNQPDGPTLKLSKPMEVLFEGVDLNIYKSVQEVSKDISDELSNIKESFVYLFVGHWLPGKLGDDRKDIGMLIKGFYETFKNKKSAPALLLKTSGGPISVMDYEDIQRKIHQIKHTVKADVLPNLYLLHGDLSDDEMNDLYNWPKIKAMINFTHGEGYGRPLAEFAASAGKPIAVSNWSGHVDFLANDLSVLLPGDMMDVPKGGVPKGIWVEKSKWFRVNYQQASTVMKDIFYNYKKYTLNGKKQQKVIRGRFSLDAMTKKLGVILDSNLPKFQEEVKLSLPKLKKVGDLPKLNPVSTEKPKMKMNLPRLKKM